MIVLHRSKVDSLADRIEEVLDDLVLAYKTKTHTNVNHTQKNSNTRLPFIDENGTITSGKEKIDEYLRELRNELKQQRAITGDGCYIDPETGEIC